MALSEWREWRQENLTAPALDCLIWTIESVGEMDIADYNDSLLDERTLTTQLADEDFNDVQYIYTLDTSVIATGFGQLVDEGQIDLDSKPLIQRAIERLTRWNGVTAQYRGEYHAKLQVLARILQQA